MTHLRPAFTLDLGFSAVDGVCLLRWSTLPSAFSDFNLPREVCATQLDLSKGCRDFSNFHFQEMFSYSVFAVLIKFSARCWV